MKVTRVNEGEVVVDTLAVKGGKTATAGGEQTERWNGIFKSDITGAGSTQPSPDRGRKVTMSWSLSEEIEWAMGAVAVKPRNVTAVQLSSFAATKSKDGVLLEWQTGYEVDNLGFHVYRE